MFPREIGARSYTNQDNMHRFSFCIKLKFSLVQNKQNKQTWDSCLARSVCFKSASFFITEDSLLSTSRCMKYENNHHFKIIVNVVFSTFYLWLHQLETEQEIEAFKKLSP